MYKKDIEQIFAGMFYELVISKIYYETPMTACSGSVIITPETLSNIKLPNTAIIQANYLKQTLYEHVQRNLLQNPNHMDPTSKTSLSLKQAKSKANIKQSPPITI